MSAHVLLNLLEELGKRDKMRGLPSILSLFCNETVAPLSGKHSTSYVRSRVVTGGSDSLKN